jgi:hypothetical protein
MNTQTPAASPQTRRPFAGHIAEDVLGLSPEGRTNFKRVVELINLSKEDISQITGVSKSVVRFDDRIPVKVAERLREIAQIANFAAEFFKGDVAKVVLWFELPNPSLGNISPRNLIRAGQYQNVRNFVLEAREAEAAAAFAPQR